jgi:threonine dehydrogenase-like Zn-dependent dehydrogenase
MKGKKECMFLLYLTFQQLYDVTKKAMAAYWLAEYNEIIKGDSKAKIDAYIAQNETAFAIARAGAIVGRVGVPHDVEIPAEGTFYRKVGMRGGPAPVRAYMAELLDAVLAGKIHPGRVFDFTTDLDHIADAYAAMDERRAIKSLLKVGTI